MKNKTCYDLQHDIVSLLGLQQLHCFMSLSVLVLGWVPPKGVRESTGGFPCSLTKGPIGTTAVLCKINPPFMRHSAVRHADHGNRIGRDDLKVQLFGWGRTPLCGGFACLPPASAQTSPPDIRSPSAASPHNTFILPPTFGQGLFGQDLFLRTGPRKVMQRSERDTETRQGTICWCFLPVA